jgi:hypothetical protein
MNHRQPFIFIEWGGLIPLRFVKSNNSEFGKSVTDSKTTSTNLNFSWIHVNAGILIGFILK